MAKRNKQTLRRIYTGREIVDSPLATCYIGCTGEEEIKEWHVPEK